jgi:hypothetical protein
MTTTATATRTYIARHTTRQLDRSRCERRAYRFDAPFVIEVRCPECGERMPKVDVIDGRSSDDRECNARCMGATTGGVCECRCGGSNHGGRWA